MSEQSESGFRRAETHKVGLSVVSAIVFAAFAGAGAVSALASRTKKPRLRRACTSPMADKRS